MIIAAAVLLIVDFAITDEKEAFSVADVQSMAPQVDYHVRSINNWGTIQEADFEGVPLHALLKESGIEDDDATVTIVAPDSYFWPKVGTSLTVADLKKESPKGMVPIIAHAVDGGDSLVAEPQGSGPLRYVAPQYDVEDVNKPSWVSNIRIIDIGHLSTDEKMTDERADELTELAKTVPENELWVMLHKRGSWAFSLLIPLITGGVGLLLLVAWLVVLLVSKRQAPADEAELTASARGDASPADEKRTGGDEDDSPENDEKR